MVNSNGIFDKEKENDRADEAAGRNGSDGTAENPANGVKSASERPEGGAECADGQTAAPSENASDSAKELSAAPAAASEAKQPRKQDVPESLPSEAEKTEDGRAVTDEKKTCHTEEKSSSCGRRFAVWERAVDSRPPEKAFYRYCLRRQPSLIRFLPMFWWYTLLRYFGLISREKYLKCRWRFLGATARLDRRLHGFFRRSERRLFFPDAPLHILSEHPSCFLAAFCEERSLPFTANHYDTKSGTFVRFRSLTDLIGEASDKAPRGSVVYDSLPSPFSGHAKATGIRLRPVCGRRIFRSGTACALYRIFRVLLTLLLLTAGMAAVGLVGLYFASITNDFTLELFKSYFRIPRLVLLNLLPGVFLAVFLYFLTNSAGFSFALASGVTLLANFVNYFKLLFRNDPLIAEDVTLINEAAGIAGRYDITISLSMWLAILACIAGSIFFFFFFRVKISLPRIRPLVLLLLAGAGVIGFGRVYQDGVLYAATENTECINPWSETQQFTSRGFVYPFLYSFSYLSDGEPEGYDAGKAADLLEGYAYDDIPADRRVNVLSVMLEAYTDFSDFPGVEFETDPYAFWHSLEEEAYSGRLVTNIFAGGTINTERCFLTGFADLPNFRSRTNSYVWYFREQGYYAEGSHPCYNWFYNRRNANEAMGFENYYFFEDTYAELYGSREYMAPDSVLFPNIQKLFEESLAERPGTPYFSFNVSYQGHGPYNTASLDGGVYVGQGEMDDESYYILNNYLDSIARTNAALEEWIGVLRDTEEPVILVLFGDHKPWMGNRNTVYEALGVSLDLSTEDGFRNYYATPYLIWANDAAKAILGSDFSGSGPEISPCFLMNEVFSLAGWGGSEYMKFMNEVKEVLPVIHTSGRYVTDGVLTQTLPEDAGRWLERFRQVQYYRQTNFQSRLFS